MDHFIDTKIPKLGIFVDKKSQNDQTPFPKVGRKKPWNWSHALERFLIMVGLSMQNLMANQALAPHLGPSIRSWRWSPTALVSLFHAVT